MVDILKNRILALVEAPHVAEKLSRFVLINYESVRWVFANKLFDSAGLDVFARQSRPIVLSDFSCSPCD